MKKTPFLLTQALTAVTNVPRGPKAHVLDFKDEKIFTGKGLGNVY